MILHIGVPERTRNEFCEVEECKITNNRLDGDDLILYSIKNCTFNQGSVYSETVDVQWNVFSFVKRNSHLGQH